MIVPIVFLLTMTQMEFNLVQNKNCEYDHISSHLKGIWNLFPLSAFPRFRKPVSKLNPRTVLVLLSPDPSLAFPFHFLLSPVHPTGFSFYFFPGFLAIFTLLSSNNNNKYVVTWPYPPYNTMCHFYPKYL